MKRYMLLTRIGLYPNITKGVLTIPGTDFSCYTLEAQNQDNAFVSNPIFKYALKQGIYRLVFRAYSYFPLVPHIKCRPYMKIGMFEQDSMRLRPGCVYVGTHFRSSNFIAGYDDVMEAIETIVKCDYKEWCRDAYIKIANSTDCVTYDNSDDDSDTTNINFARL